MVTFLKECSDSKGQARLMIFGNHHKNGDHHRDGDHPRDGGCLREFTIRRDRFLMLRELKIHWVAQKIRNLKSVSLFVCLSVCYQVGI